MDYPNGTGPWTTLTGLPMEYLKWTTLKFVANIDFSNDARTRTKDVIDRQTRLEQTMRSIRTVAI